MSRFRQEAGAVGTTRPAPRFRALLSNGEKTWTLRIRMRTHVERNTGASERGRAIRERAKRRQGIGSGGVGGVGGVGGRASERRREWWGKDSVTYETRFRDTDRGRFVSFRGRIHDATPANVSARVKGGQGTANGAVCIPLDGKQSFVTMCTQRDSSSSTSSTLYLPSSTFCSRVFFFVFITIPLRQRSIRYREARMVFVNTDCCAS